MYAAFFNNPDLLEWLIEQGADINFQDRIGYTALHFCGQEGHEEIAELLLENGANSNIRDEHGNSPLWTALFNAKDDFDIVRNLVKFGADPYEKNIHGKSPNDIAQTIYQSDLNDLLD